MTDVTWETMYAFKSFDYQDIVRQKLRISAQAVLSYGRKPSGHFLRHVVAYYSKLTGFKRKTRLLTAVAYLVCNKMT